MAARGSISWPGIACLFAVLVYCEPVGAQSFLHASALFTGSKVQGLSGSILFKQAILANFQRATDCRPACPTTNAMFNLTLPAGWQPATYQIRTGATAQGSGPCSTAGVPYNPDNMAGCAGLPRPQWIACALSDLSGKYGVLTNANALSRAVDDPNLPLYGPQSIVGRSIAITGPDGREACATLAYTADMALIMPQLSLKFAFLIGRHGIRAPFGPYTGAVPAVRYPPTMLQGYTTKPLPSPTDWGLSVEGYKNYNITPNGYNNIKKQGAWYYQRYANALNFNATCARAKNVLVWGDTTLRSTYSAAAFVSGLLPGCGASPLINDAPTTTRSDVDDLVLNQNQVFAGKFAACTPATEDQIVGLVGSYSGLVSRFTPAITTIQKAISCCPNATLACGVNSMPMPVGAPCTLLIVPTVFAGDFHAPYLSPLERAGAFSELFQLQALNGMPAAWGTQTLAETVSQSFVHDINYRLGSNLVNAKAYGSALMAYLIASLEQADTGLPQAGLLHPPNVKLLYISGHDSQLLYIQRLLGLSWLAAGWNYDSTPPGATLGFEVWQNRTSGQFLLNVFVEMQTPAQMANNLPLTADAPPGRAMLAIPGCDSVPCDLDQALGIMSESVRSTCVPDAFLPLLQMFTGHYPAPSSRAAGSLTPAYVALAVGWTAAVAFAVALGVVVSKAEEEKRKKGKRGFAEMMDRT